MSLIKSTIQITFLSAFGIILTLLSQLVVAYYFGTSFERDAYFIATVIPNYISSVVVSSFGYIFLPKVVDLTKKEKQQVLNNFINSFLFIIGGLLVFISIVGMLFSESIIRIISTGLNGQQINYSGQILRILFPTILFSSFTGFISSLYQVNYSFLKPALASILSIIISLTFFVFFNHSFGIISLAWGTLLGSIGSFLFLSPIWTSYLKQINISFRNPDFLEVLKTSTPMLLIVIIVRFSTVLERSIASGLPQGSLSYLGYANQIVSALAGVTIGGLSTTAYPVLSKAWSQNNMSFVKNNIEKFIRISLIISLFVAVIFIVHGRSIVQIIFERGHFDHKATIAVSNLLSILMGFFIMSSLGAIIPKSFYIKGKTGVIFLIGLAEITTYIFLSFILITYYSYLGLAIAQFISATVNIVISLIILHFTMVRLDFKKIFFITYQICISIIFSFLPSLLITKYDFGLFTTTLISSIVSLFIYLFFLTYIFRVEELYKIKNAIKKVSSWMG